MAKSTIKRGGKVKGIFGKGSKNKTRQARQSRQLSPENLQRLRLGVYKAINPSQKASLKNHYERIKNIKKFILEDDNFSKLSINNKNMIENITNKKITSQKKLEKIIENFRKNKEKEARLQIIIDTIKKAREAKAKAEAKAEVIEAGKEKPQTEQSTLNKNPEAIRRGPSIEPEVNVIRKQKQELELGLEKISQGKNNVESYNAKIEYLNKLLANTNINNNKKQIIVNLKQKLQGQRQRDINAGTTYENANINRNSLYVNMTGQLSPRERQIGGRIYIKKKKTLLRKKNIRKEKLKSKKKGFLRKKP